MYKGIQVIGMVVLYVFFSRIIGSSMWLKQSALEAKLHEKLFEEEVGTKASQFQLNLVAVHLYA